MTRLSTFVASAAVLVLVVPAGPASAQQTRVHFPKPETIMARSGQGLIQGVVFDATGRPVHGATVSALGSTVAFGLSGRDGRFTLSPLPAGAYTVRVHRDGYLPSRRQVVDVRGGIPALVSVAMQALSASAPGPVVLAAGMVPFEGAAPQATAADGTPLDPGAADHGHSDSAWRLRHLKRSVLRSVEAPLPVNPEAPGNDGNVFGQAFETSMRLASSRLSDLALSGQVRFVTAGDFGGPAETWSPDASATNMAYIAVGAPVGDWGQWTVRGAMNRGEVGSWFLAGSFDGRVAGAHRYSGGLSYGAQRVDDVNLLGRAAIQGGSRAIGSVFGFDEWRLGPRISLTYGLAYAWQDYVAGNGLFSPRLAMTFRPGRVVRIRGTVARYAIAPGSEELIPAASLAPGAWLPAQRSFSPWSERQGFRAQRTDHYELELERTAADLVLGFRTFFQRVDEQMGAIFAAPTFERPAASLGHYYVMAVGDLSTRGWSVSVSRPIIAGVRGSVDYSQTTTRRSPTDDSAEWTSWVVGGQPASVRFHDVTTSLETDIRQTATRLFVLYKINTGFAREGADELTPGLDARFDVQVNQALPFMAFTSADWEVLVAVRNLFRDPMHERSVMDELFVVRPPKRVVGGVRVRF